MYFKTFCTFNRKTLTLKSKMSKILKQLFSYENAYENFQIIDKQTLWVHCIFLLYQEIFNPFRAHYRWNHPLYFCNLT